MQTLIECFMQDLKHVNRSVTPWVIVHGHRPAYATVVDTGSVIQAQDQRNALEDIFVQYGVTLSLLNPVAVAWFVLLFVLIQQATQWFGRLAYRSFAYSSRK